MENRDQSAMPKRGKLTFAVSSLIFLFAVRVLVWFGFWGYWEYFKLKLWFAGFGNGAYEVVAWVSSGDSFISSGPQNS